MDLQYITVLSANLMGDQEGRHMGMLGILNHHDHRESPRYSNTLHVYHI